MARALVTGAAGFIGSHLTDALLEAGHAVLGVDCFNDNYARADKQANLAQAADHDAFELVTGDLVELDAHALIDGCDVVYHLAGEPGVRSSWGSRFERYTHHNVAATQRLLEALVDFDGKRFVYASSSSVYGDALTLPTPEDVTPHPLSPYGVTKLAAEHLTALYGEELDVNTVALRYFSVYGPRQRPDMAFRRFCEAIVGNRPIEIFGDGTQSRDFTYVGDIVAATIAAGSTATPPGRVYNIGGGGSVSLNRALETLAGIAGRPLDVRHAERQEGDVADTGADTSRAHAELGFTARTTLQDGLAAELDWVRERPAALAPVRSLTAS
ncbi:NAD-dependent epimerase/dehydratase family protein [Solirubrobacter sp. CPCC 204708]|uniref:NAD-dependent epimerase/dehydratase family protein n=1 Tax=Solirubrobacter deserti TaxID=2282478 RepID=A0ABT4RPR7_9ACTN|nr:NAD-dependent epimerase/dehydratase family protein [Solirubrobacter deserti]MBE2319926.1 NAD-dependent epimerase/dehydratase family protein [Solirubrobacter deserti]MDA0140480.1 NAD-dependent epimerase/dehydratase family protein [Solirubrobacter deserti]